MMTADAHDLYERLTAVGLLKNKPPMWWPAYGSFEVVIGAILTQNSQWSRVEVSLENLRANNLLDPHALDNCDIETLMTLIQPSGLFKSKAKYIKLLCSAIIESFGDFENFCFEVEREWLLEQKGIGKETADSILCYACQRPVMVVDAYTARLLSALGMEFEEYDDLQSWCSLEGCFSEDELPEVYALFHGMIVEYVKGYKRGRSEVLVEALKVEKDS